MSEVPNQAPVVMDTDRASQDLRVIFTVELRRNALAAHHLRHPGSQPAIRGEHNARRGIEGIQNRHRLLLPELAAVKSRAPYGCALGLAFSTERTGNSIPEGSRKLNFGTVP